MFWWQSAQVRNMKLLATLCFSAFQSETPHGGPEKSCKHCEFPPKVNNATARQLGATNFQLPNIGKARCPWVKGNGGVEKYGCHMSVCPVSYSFIPCALYVPICWGNIQQMESWHFRAKTSTITRDLFERWSLVLIRVCWNCFSHQVELEICSGPFAYPLQYSNFGVVQICAVTVMKCRPPEWNVLKHWETRLKRDLQGRTERTFNVRTLSDASYVDIETGVDWWGFHTPCFVCCFRHSSPWSPVTSKQARPIKVGFCLPLVT